MGFHARSAEEAINWILRRNSEDFWLNDGFALSFLLVNDRSQECLEFIQRYFVDLCERTAHRIRFVFFSDLSPAQAESFAHALWRGEGRHALRLAGEWWKPKLPHCEFEPEELEAATSSLEKLLQSAACSGPNQALKFAQRLGIGHLVPCIVLHPESAKAELEVYPLTHHSAKETYSLLRNWIDEYYRLNSELFHTWEEIDTEIRTILRTEQISRKNLADVRDRLNELRRIDSLFDVISESSDPAKWKTAINRISTKFLPSGVRDALPEIDKLLGNSRNMKALIDLRQELDSIDTSIPIEVFRRMLIDSDRGSRDIDDMLTKTIQRSAEQLSIALRARFRANPKAALRWWQQIVAAHPPSGKRFRNALNTWPGVAGESEIDSWKGAIAEVRMDSDAQAAASHVLSRLAHLRQIDPANTAWLDATKNYQLTLASWFESLFDKCPSFLRTESLSFGSCTSGDYSDALISVVKAVSAKSQCELACLQIQELNLVEEIKRDIVDVLEGLIRPPDEDQSLQLRAKLAGELLACKNAITGDIQSLSNPDKNPVNVEEIERLLHFLGEYESAVKGVRLPYLGDQRVVKVPLPTSLGRLIDTPNEFPPLARLRNELVEIKSSVPRNIIAATPSHRLSEAIQASIGSSEIEPLLSPNSIGSFELRLEESLGEESVTQFLSGMNESQLRLVWNKLASPGYQLPPSREALIQGIRELAGMDCRPELVGPGLMKELMARARSIALCGDSVTVYASGTEIRRRIERYLKQFIIVYSSLALSEKTKMLNETLRPLAEMVSHIVKTAKLEEPGWEEIADRFAAARNDQAWLSGIEESLTRIPDLSNVFAHDRISITVDELRSDLLAFVGAVEQLICGLDKYGLYPVSLRFTRLHADAGHFVRLEFEADPPKGGSEIVVFESWPPVLPGVSGDIFPTLVKSLLLMVPRSNPIRMEPILRPLPLA